MRLKEDRRVTRGSHQTRFLKIEAPVTIEVHAQQWEPSTIGQERDVKLKSLAWSRIEVEMNCPGMFSKSRATVGRAGLICLPMESGVAGSGDELRFIAGNRVIDLTLAGGRVDPLMELGRGLVEATDLPQHIGVGWEQRRREANHQPSGEAAEVAQPKA